MQELTRTEKISYLDKVVVGIAQSSLMKIKKRADVTSYNNGEFYIYCSSILNLEPGENLQHYFERMYPGYEMEVNIQSVDY